MFNFLKKKPIKKVAVPDGGVFSFTCSQIPGKGERGNFQTGWMRLSQHCCLLVMVSVSGIVCWSCSAGVLRSDSFHLASHISSVDILT